MTTAHEQTVGPGSPVLHLRMLGERPAGVDENLFRAVLELVGDVTPVVQALPPSAVVADVSGSLRYWNRDPAWLARVIRARVAAQFGLDVGIGVGPNWVIAAMASRETGGCGIRAVGSGRGDVEAFLHPRPVGELYGVGKQQAGLLTAFGVHTIGLLGSLPLGTVQRVLGGQPGRLLWERARGVDRRAIVPTGLPRSSSALRRFPTDTLDPEVLRAALLSCAVELGERLRSRDQAAKALTVSLTFSDRTQLTRTRQVPLGPSAHTEDLRELAYDLYDTLGLQRARVRGVALRGEQLVDAGQVAEQLTLDDLRDRRLRTEPIIDALNRRFGQGTVGPAAAFRRAG
ncbi:hypothetical protein [Streptomyces sp. MS2.AVA.5]|uniref:Uncharacterized protein n=1 Tax=Streptomyces achmelvichensis TaxID=3134111 RepID=A0ACC6PL81_9ACTN